MCALAAVATIAAAQAPGPPPDTILVNGHVITVDARFSIAEAVAISGGRFSAVGTSAAIRKLAGPKTATIDLHGQTVIPGLADGHLHALSKALYENRQPDAGAAGQAAGDGKKPGDDEVVDAEFEVKD